MGVYKRELKMLSFSSVKHHVETTCGWRYVFEQLAGDALMPAMQAKPNDHVNCPLPSHGGAEDFRFMIGWDQPGHRAGKAICTCQPKGIDGFSLLRELGLGTNKDVLTAVATASGYLADSSGRVPKVQPRPVQPVAKGPDPSWTRAKAAGRAKLYARLWGEAFRLDHPDAEVGRRYLENRGIDLKGILPHVRFHPSMQLRTREGVSNWPCLLFEISQPNGQRAGLHRVFLDYEGNKAPVVKPKRYTPFIPEMGYTGCAARVITVDDCETLNISEGPEKTLVAYLCTGETAWCTLDTTRMKELIVPTYFKKVRIWADNDREKVDPKTGQISGRAGQKAAFALAERLVKEGFIVEVMVPNREPGVDWNDLYDRVIKLMSFKKRLPLARWMSEREILSATG